jgi:hypothetical protein
VERTFRFVQLELPWRLGPPDGRYVVRDAAAEADAPAHVLVVATLAAPERRRLRDRRGREVAAEPPPEAVLTTRATVVDGAPVAAGEAERWLAAADDATVAAGFAVMARAAGAHRLAAADAGVVAPALAHALVVRAGYGAGEEVAEGRWSAARELPLPAPSRRAKRSVALAPHERLAALLGGHERALACEELALRARADLDGGRAALAALQLRVAVEAALVELPAVAGSGAFQARIEELGALAPAVSAIASAALTVPPSPDAVATLGDALARLEAALRARAAAGARRATSCGR